MGEENDRNVAVKLGRIETILERNGDDVRRLSVRLFGDEDDGLGGIVGAHNLRLQKLETWFIRVTTGVAVWTFMTGSGPVSLSTVVHLFNNKP